MPPRNFSLRSRKSHRVLRVCSGLCVESIGLQIDRCHTSISIAPVKGLASCTEKASCGTQTTEMMNPPKATIIIREIQTQHVGKHFVTRAKSNRVVEFTAEDVKRSPSPVISKKDSPSPMSDRFVPEDHIPTNNSRSRSKDKEIEKPSRADRSRSRSPHSSRSRSPHRSHLKSEERAPSVSLSPCRQPVQIKAKDVDEIVHESRSPSPKRSSEDFPLPHAKEDLNPSRSQSVEEKSPARDLSSPKRSPSPSPKKSHSTSPKRSMSSARDSISSKRSESPARDSVSPKRSKSPARESSSPRRSKSPHRMSVSPRRSKSPVRVLISPPRNVTPVRKFSESRSCSPPPPPENDRGTKRSLTPPPRPTKRSKKFQVTRSPTTPTRGAFSGFQVTRSPKGAPRRSKFKVIRSPTGARSAPYREEPPTEDKVTIVHKIGHALFAKPDSGGDDIYVPKDAFLTEEDFDALRIDDRLYVTGIRPVRGHPNKLRCMKAKIL